MSNFLRRLKAAFSMWRTFPVVVIPSDYWTDADAKAWSLFLTSDTGTKLRHLRWHRVFLTAQQAISDRQDSTFKCGVAYGVRAMVAEEDSLLAIELPQPEITEEQSAFKSVNR
jgi:hypothetical protein